MEIIAAVLRSRAKVAATKLTELTELLDAFTPVLTQCRDLLDRLLDEHVELREAGFERYRQVIVGDVT